MKYVKIGCFIILFVFANYCGLKLCTEAMMQYNSIGLRYENEISKDTIKQVKQYLNSDGRAENLFPTFWKEEKGIISNEFNQVETEILAYIGEGYQVFGAEFLLGGYPLEGGERECAVSDTLAHDFYGSQDILELEFEYKNESYRVGGVFRDDERLVLRTGEMDENYSGVELVGDMKDNPKGEIDCFVTNSGLGNPDQIVYGTTMVSIMEMICNLPILILGGWMFIYSITYVNKKHPRYRSIISFSMLLFFAINLPFLLEQLPPWILPTKWSDFSFWESLYDSMKQKIVDWFYLSPVRKDVIIKVIMAKIMLIVGIELLCIVKLYQSMKQKIK